MTRKQLLKTSGATLGLLAMLANTSAVMAADPAGSGTTLTTAQKIALLRTKVKYVFVIYAENRSFDHYFGTFPGANGLFTAPAGSTPANATPGFTQQYLDTTLAVRTVSPFLIPQTVQAVTGATVKLYPADTGSVNHSHQGIVNAMNYNPATGTSTNDRYAMTQQGLTTNASGQLVTRTGAAPTAISLAQMQQAELAVSHIDCDTIPFMWSWAKNFVLYDNFRQTIIGPSTPNAIAVIAGQSGETQWALHNNEGAVTTSPTPILGASYASRIPTNSNAFVPVVADPGPFPGSRLDTNAGKPPYNFDENASNPALNLTFASQPLSFMGSKIASIIATDPNPRADLLDVQHDIFTIATNDPFVNWGWYQQGFNANDAADPYEPQGTGTPNPALYTGYVLHHNGPQYFGYLADNPQVLNNLHGAQDFFQAVETQALPAAGGVFYLRGGYNNNDGLVSADPTPAIQHAFLGNDDHPAYSDAQISEAFAARAINDIAASPYWPQSAIIITYDETDGLYDHEAPHVRSLFADGSPLAGGPRIPAIVISPFAAAGTISHQYSEHGSIIKFINGLFGLVPLASLPDEKHARALGAAQLGQPNLEPSDDPANELGDLTEAFDNDILLGNKLPIPTSAATFPATTVFSIPPFANGCSAIGVLPTDYPTLAAYNAGLPIDPPPADFNPRPSQSPGTPTSGAWIP